ncbi:MAG TPA: ABC-2 family transporter protein [Pirellulaceae bacterium]|nr:ABC-2 family transporter protein [Pirellulaceae bacterium]HMO91873.1 ABC-2 family transporter protein [Pirellulaceae bacterium]HMP69717.1 ABC-2 family transporter protein [Pirellulaceae bacterium]
MTAHLVTLRQKSMTWWTFFRVSIEERLVYRADFALGTLMRFMQVVILIFLYAAIYETVAPPTNETAAAEGIETTAQIQGYTFNNVIAYVLLVYISRAFSSMPGLTSGIATQVRNGEIKKFLIQPVDMLGCLMLQRVAHKLVYYLIAILPFAFVFFLARGYFEDGWPSLEVMIVFLVSLLLGFLLGYFLEACLGLVSFWLLEISSLTFVYMLLSFLLSGHMFPLDWIPSEPINFRYAVDCLPFKYLAYFPAAVFLGKVSGEDMYWGLIGELAWVIFFAVLARILWQRGVKRYSGFGG